MVGMGSFGGSGKAGGLAIIATPLPSKVAPGGSVEDRISDMRQSIDGGAGFAGTAI